MRFWQNGGGSTLPFCFGLQCDYFHGCTMNAELKERSAAVYYLSDKDTPFLTLAELAELIEAFTIHLECNKDVLIRPDYTESIFTGPGGFIHPLAIFTTLKCHWPSTPYH